MPVSLNQAAGVRIRDCAAFVNAPSDAYGLYLGAVSDVLISGAQIRGDTNGIYASSYISGVVTLENCLISADQNEGLMIAAANAGTKLNIVNCTISAGNYAAYALNQTSAASTVRSYITGNVFNTSVIRVNGVFYDSSLSGESIYLYMPRYANKFGL